MMQRRQKVEKVDCPLTVLLKTVRSTPNIQEMVGVGLWWYVTGPTKLRKGFITGGMKSG